ncbi:Mor transcription activator family protein [Clostridium lundense]|uniref:Mor transcription activator family protein n=1 Tax=Clostridium lundense TaxID=319475 RepID=UPI0004810A4B|nr:Mor transcription activator family protein [Clostridium lundense]
MEELDKELLNPDILPEPYAYYAKIIGIDNLCKIAEKLGGTTIYIPKYDTLFKTIRNEKIKKEFNGYNYQDLAIKYNICERTVRNICDGVVPVIDGQVTLFDSL